MSPGGGIPNYPKKALCELFSIAVTRLSLFDLSLEQLPNSFFDSSELRDITRLGLVSCRISIQLPVPDLNFSELIG